MAANLDFNLILVHGFADVTVTELHFYNRNCVSVLETAFRNKKNCILHTGSSVPYWKYW